MAATKKTFSVLFIILAIIIVAFSVLYIFGDKIFPTEDAEKEKQKTQQGIRATGQSVSALPVGQLAVGRLAYATQTGKIDARNLSKGIDEKLKIEKNTPIGIVKKVLPYNWIIDKNGTSWQIPSQYVYII